MLNANELKILALYCLDMSSKQKSIVINGINAKLTEEQIKLYANSKFNWQQMEQIFLGFVNRLDMEQIQTYALLGLDYSIMKRIREKFLEINISKFHPDLTNSQRKIVVKGFEENLTLEQVKFYAKPEFDWQQMEQIELGFQNGLDISQIQTYALPELNHNIMKRIRITYLHF